MGKSIENETIFNTAPQTENNSYKQMAKSSGIVAFVQIFQMLFGLVRNKAIALIVGTSGFGIWSLYHTFLEMTGNFSVFGLDRGGVREIAKKAEKTEELGKCIFSFRFIIFVFATICSIIVFVGSKEISLFVFNDVSYSLGIKTISIVVILQGVFKAEYSILNGLHAIKYIAYSQIIGAVAGSVGAILFVYFGREEYIVFGLSVVIISGVLTTSYYVHKLKVKTIWPQFREFLPISKRLLYLGLGYTVSGLVSTVMTLLSRSYLSSHYSLDAVGIYQASWTISNLYIGIILNAMGIDFLPRLSKVSEDND